MKTIKVHSKNISSTINLGRSIGQNLKGGEVIELIGDLGSGKTTLIKGITLGATKVDMATSPSFSLINEYASSSIRLYHCDFYRLNPDQELLQSLGDILKDQKATVLIEWPKSSKTILPETRLRITISPRDNDSRDILINYPTKLSYVLPDN